MKLDIDEIAFAVTMLALARKIAAIDDKRLEKMLCDESGVLGEGNPIVGMPAPIEGMRTALALVLFTAREMREVLPSSQAVKVSNEMMIDSLPEEAKKAIKEVLNKLGL